MPAVRPPAYCTQHKLPKLDESWALVDVVVSAKEAEMSKEQLMRERKVMSEELAKLKAELRRTLSDQERVE